VSKQVRTATADYSFDAPACQRGEAQRHDGSGGLVFESPAGSTAVETDQVPGQLEGELPGDVGLARIAEPRCHAVDRLAALE
jgi:hypothetical protein